MNFPPLVISLIIAATLSAGLIIYVARQQRLTAGSGAFLLLMSGVVIWSLAYALELQGTDLPAKMFWLRTKYIGVVIVPVAWFAFAFSYVGIRTRERG